MLGQSVEYYAGSRRARGGYRSRNLIAHIAGLSGALGLCVALACPTLAYAQFAFPTDHDVSGGDKPDMQLGIDASHAGFALGQDPTQLDATADGANSRPDLEQIFRTALAQNEQYQAARASYQAALEATPQARGQLLPKLSAQASYTENYQSVNGELAQNVNIDKDESFQRQNYGVQLTQPLFHWDAFIGLKQADVKIKKAHLDLVDARSKLAMKVAKAYFQRLDAGNNLHYVRAEKRALKHQLKQVQNKFTAGLSTNAELQSAQSQVDMAAANGVSALNQLQVSRNQLNNLTGLSYSNIRTLPEQASLPALSPHQAEPWIAAALEYNAALRAQRAGTQIAKLNIDKAKAQRLPTLDVVGSYTYADQNGGYYSESGAGGANSNEDGRIGVQLSVPIFNGGLVSSRVRESRAQHDQQQSLQQQQRTDTIQQTQSAFLDLKRDHARIHAYAQAKQSSGAAAKAARVGFNVGTSTSADVLRALRNKYAAQRNYSESRSQYLLDLLKLKKLTGQLDLNALSVVDQRLQ